MGDPDRIPGLALASSAPATVGFWGVKQLMGVLSLFRFFSSINKYFKTDCI